MKRKKESYLDVRRIHLNGMRGALDCSFVLFLHMNECSQSYKFNLSGGHVAEKDGLRIILLSVAHAIFVVFIT